MSTVDVIREARRDKVSRWLLVVLIVVVAVGSTSVILAFRPKTVDVVLHNPSPQKVHNTLPGVDGPAATVDEAVRVTGEKCNLLDVPVEVYGEVSWRPVFPAGGGTRTTSGQAVRDPGCAPIDFANQVPADVRAMTAELAELTGGGFVVWQIAGREVPQCANCAAEGWHTESFRLYLEAPGG